MWSTPGRWRRIGSVKPIKSRLGIAFIAGELWLTLSLHAAGCNAPGNSGAVAAKLFGYFLTLPYLLWRDGKQVCQCMLRILFRSSGLALALLLTACGHKAEVVRPNGVPADAVFVRGAKIGWWQQCTAGSSGKPVHCQIWGGTGGVLVDEEFLPYDGGPPPTAGELKIATAPTIPGPDRVVLSNKRVLLPESRFGELKNFVDWWNGKSNQPP